MPPTPLPHLNASYVFAYTLAKDFQHNCRLSHIRVVWTLVSFFYLLNCNFASLRDSSTFEQPHRNLKFYKVKEHHRRFYPIPVFYTLARILLYTAAETQQRIDQLEAYRLFKTPKANQIHSFVTQLSVCTCNHQECYSMSSIRKTITMQVPRLYPSDNRESPATKIVRTEHKSIVRPTSLEK